MLQRTGRGSEVVEVGQPAKCVNGHQLVAPNLLVGYLPCVCAPAERGHRTFTCKTCWDVTYMPEHDRAQMPPPR